MLRLFVHIRQWNRGLLGTGESHHYHWEETLIQKTRHIQNKTSQRESHLLRGWHSVSLVDNIYSVPFCPSPTLWHRLWHKNKGAVFNTVLRLWAEFFLWKSNPYIFMQQKQRNNSYNATLLHMIRYYRKCKVTTWRNLMRRWRRWERVQKFKHATK